MTWPKNTEITGSEPTQVWGSEIRDKEIYQTLILSDVAAKNEVKTILKGANRRTYALAGQNAEAPVYFKVKSLQLRKWERVFYSVQGCPMNGSGSLLMNHFFNKCPQ